MRSLFADCRNIDELDLRGLNTSACEEMSRMFYQCSQLQSVDLSSFNTGNVKSMEAMFFSCTKLEDIDLSGFDTSSVMNTGWMFENCQALESLDLSNFNTPNLKKMYRMFTSCYNLKDLDLSGFNTSKVVNMGELFDGDTALQSVTFGPQWNIWITDAPLPGGVWTDGHTYKQGADVCGFWDVSRDAGTWTKTDKDTYGEILPEDRATYDSLYRPTGLWTSDLAAEMEYTGKAVQQAFRVYDGQHLLTKGKDYTVSYSSNTKVGTATVTIKGKGNYQGTIKKTFSIVPIHMDSTNTVVKLQKDVYKATGSAIKPKVSSVKYNGKKLSSKTDYKVTYESNPVAPGTYHVTVKGKGNYEGSVLAEYTVTNLIPVNTLEITLQYTKKAYTGSPLKPTVKIKKGTATLDSSAFSITYADNTAVGKAKVIVEGDGVTYYGAVTKTFTITGTTLKDVKITGFKMRCPTITVSTWCRR